MIYVRRRTEHPVQGVENAADRAVSIARAVKGVTSVQNHIKIVADK